MMKTYPAHIIFEVCRRKLRGYEPGEPIEFEAGDELP